MNAIIDKGYRVLPLFLLVFLLIQAGDGVAAEQEIPVKSIALLTVDDGGRPLKYPSTVFCDKVVDDIYLVNAITGRVVVYDFDFFPAVSIGVGRGVEAPRGGVVLENGEVYLLQIQNKTSKRSRITVFNGAFFVEREIFIDELPEAANFSPRELAISRDGLIYLAGSSSRGVLVLDNDGKFLRRLEPLDQTMQKVLEEKSAESKSSPEAEKKESEALIDIEIPESDTVAGPVADIPEEYLPRSGQRGSGSAPLKGLSPVLIEHVNIDSTGRIYLLSAETSKVYVYGPDETFLFSFGRKGGSPRYLSQPRALAIDEKRGLIYVVDYMRHAILAYSMTGEYKFEFGGRGTGPGWFNFPQDITINSKGQLIVADLFNHRAQVLEVDFEEFSPSQNELIWGKEGELKDETLKDETLKDETLKDETLKDESLKDESLKDESLKDESLKESVIEETLIEETLIEEKPAVIPEAESSGSGDRDSQ